MRPSDIERRGASRGGPLRPAVALMNRLSYREKFLLISVLFAAPLALVMNLLISELQERTDQTRKETLGTLYLRPLMGLFRHAGEARLLARASAEGKSGARSAFLRKQGEVDADFHALGSVDRDLGRTLRSSDQLAALEKKWRALVLGANRPDARDADPLFVAFLGEIRALVSLVGDNLVLDPDLETYHLMDAILLQLPEGQALLMEAGFRGSAVVASQPLAPEERERLVGLANAIQNNVHATRRGIEIAFRNNPSQRLVRSLRRPYDAFVSVVEGYLQTFQREIVFATPIEIESEAVTAATARALGTSFDLWDRTAAELDRMMRARLQVFERRKQIAWIATLVILVFVTYLWAAFYVAVRRTVDRLEVASDRMLGGEDPGQAIVLETRDELGRVAESFNAVARRLRHEWEQAHEEKVRAQAAEARLAESEERTRLIVQGALDAVISIDPEGMIVGWNTQAATVFGWTRDEVVGMRLSEIIIPREYRERHEDGLRRFRATGDGPILNQRIEIMALRRDGTEFPAELAITPIRYAGGTWFSAFLRDITERKSAEEDLRLKTAQANSANQAKSRFLASMSHELRTPLNSVIGFANVLLRGKGKHLKTEDVAYLERIVANGMHLLGLINSILDLSKIEAEKLDVRLASVPVGALVRETVAQLEGRVVDRDVVLVAEVPDDLEPLETDPDKLRQVLINLIGNALKFTERGSVTVRVVAEDDDRRPWRIDVIDTGVGIPKDMQQRIFEAFQQVDTGTTRAYEGTGLGLSISRALCRLMGHRIELESEVGQGSTFRVLLRLPLAASGQEARAVPLQTALQRSVPPAAELDSWIAPRPGDAPRVFAPPRIAVPIRRSLAGLVPTFLDNRRKELPVLRAALDSGDYDVLRVAGHNMKGVGASYGFVPITEIGGAMEGSAMARAADDLRRQIAALADYLERVEVIVQE